MKTVIHVNQHKIKSNRKNGERDHVITVKSGKRNRYTSGVVLVDDLGREIAKVVYRPDKPLACGAECWIEAKDWSVRVINT